MTPIQKSIQDYLALRRELGFKLRDAALCLSQFAAFMDAQGATRITTELALTWVQQNSSIRPSTRAQRLGHVRTFARYHVANDPQTEIPPPGLLPFRAARARPYLYSDEEIERLLLLRRAADAGYGIGQIARLPQERLLDLLGISWIQAPSEGEAQAAHLTKAENIYATISQDYDSLLFGTPILIRNLALIKII